MMKIVIDSKTTYSNNYAWGRVMDDKMTFEIKTIQNNVITVLSTYYCTKDKLLKVKPYKSIRKYFIEDEKIIKVIETESTIQSDYNIERRKKYRLFFEWAFIKHQLAIDDFKFDKKGGEKLKQTITKYLRGNN